MHIDRDGIDEVVVGWVTPTGQVVIETIDHDGRARRAVISQLYGDDHISPAISIEADDRITAYWSAHNGSAMYYRTTRRPADIARWGHTRQMPSNTPGGLGFTYPNPVILPSEHNEHYLFWRGGNWEPSLSMRADHGGWGRAHVIIDMPGARPYVKVASNNRDRIGLAFTNGHPDNDVTSVYFVEMRRGAMYTANGRWLGRLGARPLVPTPAELVYDAYANHDVRSWVFDTAFDHAGAPIVVYALYPAAAPAQYWYARWDGRSWLRHVLVNAGASIMAGEPHYLGGLVLDHGDPGYVYISTPSNRRDQIQQWRTSDGGRSWTHTQLTYGGEPNYRPVLAQELDSRTPAATLFSMRGPYISYWHYRTDITMMSDVFRIRSTTRASTAVTATANVRVSSVGSDAGD